MNKNKNKYKNNIIKYSKNLSYCKNLYYYYYYFSIFIFTIFILQIKTNPCPYQEKENTKEDNNAINNNNNNNNNNNKINDKYIIFNFKIMVIVSKVA